MSTPVDDRVTDEIEALEAILMHDVVVKCVEDVPKIIETVVHPSTGDDVDQQFVCVTLEVHLTPEYPDSSPEVTLRNPRGLDDMLLATINSQIKEKLAIRLGQPVVFELIELIRESLTESNLPKGQCAICLYDFSEGDAFIKTQCYHHFHNRCLANHLIASEKYFQEEFDKLPNWQQMQAPTIQSSFQQTCPVCRCVVTCDVETLKNSPPPVHSVSAPPFCLTAELKELQLKMAKLLARQIAKGGVVGMGDTGPPPLTITSPADNDNEASGVSSGTSKAEVAGNSRPNGHCSNDNSSPGSPSSRPVYRGPYRGFNRRGKPGRRGRGGAR